MRLINKAKKGDYPDYAEMYMKWLPDDGKVLELYLLPERILFNIKF